MDTARLHTEKAKSLGRRTAACMLFVVVATATSACVAGISHDGYGALRWIPSVLSGVSSIVVAILHRSEWGRQTGVHDVLAELNTPTRSPTEDRIAAMSAAVLELDTRRQSLFTTCSALSRRILSR